MVATDGHRLAMVETDHKFEGFSTETRVLVPKKAMTEVQRLAAEAGDEDLVDFAQDESHLFFQFGGRLLTSRKLTGQFPNYEAVLAARRQQNDRARAWRACRTRSAAFRNSPTSARTP